MNRHLLSLFFLTLVGLVSLPQTIEAQSNRVELEILIGNEVGIDKRQEWMEVLSKVGADSLRMRSANRGDKIRVTASPNGDYELCKLVGQVTRRNQLTLPGGTFSKRDVAGIKALIQKIRDDGAEVALSDKKAFGLTSRQLITVHKQFGKPHLGITKGVKASEIVSTINDSIDTPMDLHEDAREILEEDYIIEDELSGLSSGTVLAAVLRPLGLVAMPDHPQGGETRVLILPSDKAEEHWPIGWPIEEIQSRVSPRMYETFSMRVENVGLRDVLDAIQRKAGVPFLFDYNSLAKKGIELNEKQVTLIEEKVSYARAVSKLLQGSRLYLKSEMRVDEAGKPFMWITTY